MELQVIGCPLEKSIIFNFNIIEVHIKQYTINDRFHYYFGIFPVNCRSRHCRIKINLILRTCCEGTQICFRQFICNQAEVAGSIVGTVSGNGHSQGNIGARRVRRIQRRDKNVGIIIPVVVIDDTVAVLVGNSTSESDSFFLMFAAAIGFKR